MRGPGFGCVWRLLRLGLRLGFEGLDVGDGKRVRVVESGCGLLLPMLLLFWEAVF